MTLSVYAAQWLAHVRQTRRLSTHRAYTAHLRCYVLPYLGSDTLRSIRRRDIVALAELLAARELAANSICTTLRILGTMFRRARDTEVIGSIPTEGVAREYRKAIRKGHPMPPSLLGTVLEHANATEPESRAALLGLLAAGGVRLGEALGLQWTDLDLSTERLYVQRTFYENGTEGLPKTGHPRWVDVPRDILGRLLSLPHWNEWVFAAGKGKKPWRPSTISEMIRRLRDQIGWRPREFTSHSIRHSYLSGLVAGGIALEYAQQQAGHSSISTTRDLYARSARVPRPENLAAVVADLSGQHLRHAAPQRAGPPSARKKAG